MFRTKAPARVSERNFTEEMVRLFKAEIDNFFDRKAYFDFRNLNLEKLDVE
jgi:tRNA isopentenyl-2-thiomethyl-A-37 hydroxylase MiaE